MSLFLWSALVCSFLPLFYSLFFFCSLGLFPLFSFPLFLLTPRPSGTFSDVALSLLKPVALLGSGDILGGVRLLLGSATPNTESAPSPPTPTPPHALGQQSCTVSSASTHPFLHLGHRPALTGQVLTHPAGRSWNTQAHSCPSHLGQALLVALTWTGSAQLSHVVC